MVVKFAQFPSFNLKTSTCRYMNKDARSQLFLNKTKQFILEDQICIVRRDMSNLVSLILS